MSETGGSFEVVTNGGEMEAPIDWKKRPPLTCEQMQDMMQAIPPVDEQIGGFIFESDEPS